MLDKIGQIDGPAPRLRRRRTQRPARHAALALALLATAGCYTFSSPIGVPLPTVKRFDSEFRTYSRLHPNKSLAVAGDTADIYVSGYSHRETSETAAVEAALAACEARRRDRRVEAPCRTYAIGDLTVETAGLATETLVR